MLLPVSLYFGWCLQQQPCFLLGSLSLHGQASRGILVLSSFHEMAMKLSLWVLRSSPGLGLTGPSLTNFTL